jgi:glycosyltransferase involved in cell wall biosynthesis
MGRLPCGPPPFRRARVGIVGFNSASGLGYLMRDLATHGIADQWLVVSDPRNVPLDFPRTRAEIEIAPQQPSERYLANWLSRLDWVLLAEWCPFPELPRLAQEQGVRLALVPMWEHLSPLANWLRSIDLLICPTRWAYGMFQEWKKRFGFSWDVRYLAWPVSVERFRFRRRERCESLVFVCGRGGAQPLPFDGTPGRGTRRKGLDLVLAAARLEPDIPWIVYSQDSDIRAPSRNVVFRPPPRDNIGLYDEGDMCVQPSRFEGLGLPLLECQAAGLPLVTTHAPPMNEYEPFGLLHADGWTWGQLCEAQPICLPVIEPQSLVNVVRHLYGRDLRAASDAARAFIEREHNWAHAAAELQHWFDAAI